LPNILDFSLRDYNSFFWPGVDWFAHSTYLDII